MSGDETAKATRSGPDRAGYQAADELLHTRIVVASGNQFFQQMAAIIRGALAAANPIVTARPGAWSRRSSGAMRRKQKRLRSR